MIAYCIKSPSGNLQITEIDYTEFGVIGGFLKIMNYGLKDKKNWEEYKNQGYKIVAVEVNEVPSFHLTVYSKLSHFCHKFNVTS